MHPLFLTVSTRAVVTLRHRHRMSFARVALALAMLGALPARADWTIEKTSETPPAPAALEFRQLEITNGSGSARLWVVRFDPRKHTLAVMDNPEGAFTLAKAAEKRGALAAVNGGFFHPDNRPSGIVVRQGKTLHPWERAKLLSGVVFSTAGKVAIARAAEFKASPAVREALQAGPFLVDGGKAVPGLNTGRVAARTVVFSDAQNRFGFAVCLHVNLAEMGEILATPALVSPGKITRALNLDGGSSTGLWAKSPPDGIFGTREDVNVRNYLGIVPR